MYLKKARAVLELLNNKTRKLEPTKERILKKFDKIKNIVEQANEYKFSVKDAVTGTFVFGCTIVGPTEDEFVAVVAQAINNNVSDEIEGETVMNAASIQLKCKLETGEVVLLCGDAAPAFLHNLDGYDIIQLPHHGNYDSAIEIFDKLKNPGSKLFLISDNTGSGKTSGGADKLLSSAEIAGKRKMHTQNGAIELPEKIEYRSGNSMTKGGIYIPPTQKTDGYGI